MSTQMEQNQEKSVTWTDFPPIAGQTASDQWTDFPVIDGAEKSDEWTDFPDIALVPPTPPDYGPMVWLFATKTNLIRPIDIINGGIR